MSPRHIRDHEGLGVIVTLERRADPEEECQSVHVAHKSKREALRRAVSPFDAAVWRVRTISTPESIYDDLTHARKLIYPSDLVRGGESEYRTQQAAFTSGGVVLPELYALTGAGLKAHL